LQVRERERGREGGRGEERREELKFLGLDHLNPIGDNVLEKNKGYVILKINEISKINVRRGVM